MPDYVEPEYPVENKGNSDSNDYIKKLLKEIRDQDNHNEEPTEEKTPKVKTEWRGNPHFFYFDLSYYLFKFNYIFWLDRSIVFLHPHLSFFI